MSWAIILIAIIFLSTSLFVVYSLMRKLNERKQVVVDNLSILQEEMDLKKDVLKELAEINLGLASVDLRDQAKADVAMEEDVLRGEKGKSTIVQAELEAVDLRLRELEEIQRELEASSLEASRELEMLRMQEKEFEQKNAKLRANLESIFMQLDQLMNSLSSSQEAVDKLLSAKNDLIQTQDKIQYYEDNISLLNKKYMDLKRAYDALDIEYAQLYEKQSHG
jgi:chromosome segregation ATPase